jgi:hypothetical protein
MNEGNVGMPFQYPHSKLATFVMGLVVTLIIVTAVVGFIEQQQAFTTIKPLQNLFGAGK